MASEIYFDGKGGGPQRTITALLESGADGTATITTDAADPVFGKVYSWQVVPFTDSFQPTNNCTLTAKDGNNLSVVRSPAALNAAVSNSTPAEATVLDANGLTAPFMINNGRITFAGSGMGVGKKLYFTVNVLR